MKGFKRSFGPTLLIAGGSYVCFIAFGLMADFYVETFTFLDSIAELHAIAALEWPGGGPYSACFPI